MKKFLISVGVLSLLLTFSYSASQVLGATTQTRLLSQTDTTDEEMDEACTDCGDEVETCEKDIWSCKSWSTCSTDGVQKRTCTLIDDCLDAKTPKPAESQSCKPAVSPTAPPTTTPPPTSATGKTPEAVKTTDEKTEEQKKLEAEKAAALQKAIELRNAAAQKNIEEAKKAAEARKAEEAAKALEAAKKEEAAKKALAEEEAYKAEVLQKQAQEEAQKKAEEEAFKAAEEQRKIEEAQKKAEEEIRLAKEEEFRKQAEEEARKVAEEELAAKQREEEQRQKELEAKIAETPVFEHIFTALPTPPTPVAQLFNDNNSNGIPDNLEAFPSKVDEELIRFQADLRVRELRLITDQGKTQEEAQAAIFKAFKKKKAQKKVVAIREVYKKRYGMDIKNSKQGTEKSGTSDEVAVLLGMNPGETVSAKTNILPLEKKLLRLKDAASVEKKCSMSVANGDKLASDGFTILAACPKNRTFDLIAVDSHGGQTTIDTKTTSDNGKLVYVVDKKLGVGNFIFQMKEKPSHPLGFLPGSWFASTLDSTDSAPVESDPVLVNVVENTSVPEPEVQSIEGIDVAGLKDIKISATADGKVRVTGLADISTMVVGTFSSAVFTSAILADVESGSFEVISPRPLETGDHEVVIYATKPEESTQSPPAKLRFSIIETAQASDIINDNSPQRPVATVRAQEGGPQKFPLIPVLAFGGLAALFIGIGLYLKKSKKANV